MTEEFSETVPRPKQRLCEKCEKVPLPSFSALNICNGCWWAEQRMNPPMPEAKPTSAPVAAPTSDVVSDPDVGADAPMTQEQYAKEYHESATFACAACKERERQLVAMLARAADQAERAAAAPDTATPLTFPPTSGSFVILPGTVTDGDTVVFYWMVPDKGRLFGIQAPELHGPTAKAGQDAKAALEHLIADLGPLRADIHGREKYGRCLIDLKLPDGRSVSAVLIAAGHAVAWDGKGSRPE